MLRWSNHPWFISIGGGIIVAIIVAVGGVVFGPFVNSAVPIIGTTPPPSPKIKIDVRANSFKIPEIYRGTLFVQLERELTLKFVTKNKMNETEAKREALKFMASMYEIKLFKNIFEMADAGGYN
jgi:hypothetical protein